MRGEEILPSPIETQRGLVSPEENTSLRDGRTKWIKAGGRGWSSPHSALARPPTKSSLTLDTPNCSRQCSRPSYLDLSLTRCSWTSSFLLSVCLCPFVCASILCSIIMDPFFGWTATALTAYLAGCDVFGNNTPTCNVTDVASQGRSVSTPVSLDH